MKITSTAFGDGEYIPVKYSKNGGNISPPLSIAEIPDGTKSLALICHDPDAPIEGGFTHWVVWNIAPETTEILENSIPAGSVQGLSDWKTNTWGGPQPPSGTHRYDFYLYALDTDLNLPANTDRGGLEAAMGGHIIDTSKITGLYSA